MGEKKRRKKEKKARTNINNSPWEEKRIRGHVIKPPHLCLLSAYNVPFFFPLDIGTAQSRILLSWSSHLPVKTESKPKFINKTSAVT